MSMILYNLRYRGPFEYEKFALDTYQLANDAKLVEKQAKEKEMKAVKEAANNLNILFEEMTGETCPAMTLLLHKIDLEGIRDK